MTRTRAPHSHRGSFRWDSGCSLSRGSSCQSWDGTSNSERSPSLRTCLDSSEAFHRERGPGRQRSGKLSSEQARRRQECAVVTSSSHRPLQRWDGGAASGVGSQGEKSAQAVFSGAGGEGPTRRAASPPPRVGARARPCRHSTKKRTSTTSRAAKRTAMAHHWRRSLVM